MSGGRLRDRMLVGPVRRKLRHPTLPPGVRFAIRCSPRQRSADRRRRLRTVRPFRRRDAPLLPLRYYEIDPSYNVPAALRLSEDRPVFEMPTSTGTLRRMERVGVLEFKLNGQPMTLAAFVEEGTRVSRRFSSRSPIRRRARRISAGRYLDLHPATGIYAIDFNKAYNPYLRLQRHIRMSVPAAVESSEARGSRG